ncbi:ER membrane protein complex subunit 2 isoform X4 [Calonectris borealis]|uniref:ER membrane protein complex subunit 2 isoform X4 n=1 Tax=Calonectris borealis TaxID=1323832 RepID=UPI003F4B1D1A
MAKVSEMYDVTWEDMRDKMRKWREENYRNSEQIVDVGEELINEYASKLGDDIWIIYEQVMIAALDCSRDDLALAARKRKIAIRKAQGKNLEAIRELNEYLEQFVGDQEAWHELAELYINEHDYAKAAFCLEELMMTNPHNHLYCQQYAEVKYTQGGLENLELSRKYFAQALKLNNRNMRALFGLYMSASHIASNPKASAKMKKDNMKYASWAANQINRAYQCQNPIFNFSLAAAVSQLILPNGLLTSSIYYGIKLGFSFMANAVFLIHCMSIHCQECSFLRLMCF